MSIGQPQPGSVVSEDEQKLADLLDNTYVSRRLPSETGAIGHPEGRNDQDSTHHFRWQQWLNFSQKGDESHVTLSDGLKGCMYSQAEV
jgi:telomerase reverse transcriptase